MYIKFEDTKLKSGEVMEVGVVIAPDEKYADKIAPFLGHKPGNYKWHVERSVKEVLDQLETRFYIGQLNDEIICNIMTVEHRKAGILGHVFTKPEQRMKGACKGVMGPQMEDFRRRGGEILYLGTGYDSPPYHIYKSFGFYSVLPGSGFMRYGAISDFDAKYFAKAKTVARDVKWHDWSTVNVLTAIIEADYLRSLAFRMYGVRNFEGGFLVFKRDLEEGRYKQAKILESENAAIVGIATLKSDETWRGNVHLLDIFLHPNFFSDGNKLLEAIEFPSGKIQCYADLESTQKRQLLESFGFKREAILKDQLRDKDKTYDVILFSKSAAKTKTVVSLPEVGKSTRTSTADRPKIGCVSWCFHSFAGGSRPEEAIDLIGDIGFEGVELILLAREDIKGYWTRAQVSQLKKQLERKRLELAQFVIFQPVIEGLTSTNLEERQRNLDYFEAGCRLGKSLGAPLINIVAPWARELRRPGGGYLPRYYELSDPKAGEKFHIDIAPGFDWGRLWQTYVETMKACLERVKAHGMKLSIEHHTHTMIHDATAFLRLWDAIQDPALGYNLDVGWTLSQREYPPVAIHKVKNHLMNLHARDIDGLMRQFVHVGEGVMDFKAIAEALKAIGFRGFLSIEQDKHPGDMKATCQRYLNLMKECLSLSTTPP